MLKCRKCQIPKPATDFKKTPQNPTGRDSLCKQCYNTDNRVYNAQYRATPKGIAANMWTSIRSRVNNTDKKHPAYSKIELRISRNEFIAWAAPELKLWIGAHPDETPSINRKNGLGHYELENIEILSHAQNAGQHNPVTTDSLARFVISSCYRHSLSLSNVIRYLRDYKEQ